MKKIVDAGGGGVLSANFCLKKKGAHRLGQKDTCHREDTLLVVAGVSELLIESNPCPSVYPVPHDGWSETTIQRGNPCNVARGKRTDH